MASGWTMFKVRWSILNTLIPMSCHYLLIGMSDASTEHHSGMCVRIAKKKMSKKVFLRQRRLSKNMNIDIPPIPDGYRLLAREELRNMLGSIRGFALSEGKWKTHANGMVWVSPSSDETFIIKDGQGSL